MNKLEAAYAARLEAQKCSGDVLWFAYEAITLKLAHDCRYTPDFLVMRADGVLEAHEVKGFFRDDAKVKLKVAADKFPFRFLLITKSKNEWLTKEVAGTL